MTINSRVVEADIARTPLWVFAGNETHPCRMDEIQTSEEAVIILHGSASHTCNFHVNATDMTDGS